MPNFKTPQYAKVTNPKTGVQEPSYTFNIEFTDNDTKLSFVADNESDITLQNLQKCVIENVSWWNTFIGQFLQTTSKLFAKPYTVENINKISKHTLNGARNFSFPSNLILTPKSIQITGNNFIVNWEYDAESIIINIPDFIENDIDNNGNTQLPVKNENTIMNGIEELNIDELPVGDETTEALEIDSPAKFYDKQRIKEARLKAKLAIYKVQRQMAKFYDKYGEELSDSESDEDTSDEDIEEDSEEEIQL
jgi:hypothetical protein